MSSFLSFLLTAAMLFSSAAGAVQSSAAQDAVPAAAAASADAEVPALPAADVSPDDIRYVHYDPEAFYARTDELRRLARAGDADAVNALYDELYDEFLYIDSLSVLTMLRSDADIYDEYWSDEYLYMNDLWSLCEEALFSAGAAVLDTGCAEAFTQHIGEDTAQLFRTYDPLTDEQLEASDREIELVDEYRALYDTIDDTEFAYLGETWTLDRFFGFPGQALADRDYDAYLEVYSGLQRTLCEKFAPIYIELVDLWKQEARDAGYDSYADYAYESVYGRSYTPADAQLFCDTVKPIAREYYEDLYYSDMAYDEGAVAPVFSARELIDILGEYLPRVDESLTEPWRALTENGLYDIAPSAPGRYDGAYTTVMLYFRSPFLFASLTGDCTDLITMTHEYGHFCDYWFHPQTNVFTQVDDLDVSEIHSNALQALFTTFYGEIYGEGSDVAEFINLSNLLDNVFDGCVQDEFQRRVFAETEPLTPERLNELYTQVCAEYGMYDERDWDSTWVYISHNFEQPLYYISYAASGMAALQIWDIAQTDFDAAVDVYKNVLDHGSYSAGYLAVLEDAGLRSFRDDGAADEICRPVLDRLQALDTAYYG